MGQDIHLKYNFKLIILFFILLYCIIAILFFNFYKNLAIQDTQQEAISILNTMKASRKYIEEVQRPLISNLKLKGDLPNNFFDPRILSSSYITKEIFDILLSNKKIHFKYNLASINPTNPKNRANAFEAKILQRFRKGKIKKYFEIKKEKNEDIFYMALPISKNKPSCLECHGDPKIAPPGMIAKYGNTTGFYEKVGEIRALISLRVPVSNILTYHIKEFLIGGFAMFLAFSLFIFFSYLLYRKDLLLQEKKEKLLKNQNKLASMGEMINNIAHQWRQPLTRLSSILVNIELRAKKKKLTQEIIEEKILEANEQISFMSNTINDFRNFYLKDHQERKYSIEEVLQHAEQLVSASLYENNIKLQINIKNNFTLYGCPNNLTQAVINIINNAKDALSTQKIKHKIISIKTFIENDKKTLWIEDNGGGVDTKIINKIFNPYFTTKHPSIGTGIGLYMSKTLIEKKSNGQINVKNTAQGVLFIITWEC